ncbi:MULTISPECIES: hypothetical protein [Emticicia]|uniref:hypothetical protein n=1 Tax=Emticicia TaxID=312278 RepID=UPI0007D8A0C8|nr:MULTISPECIES: hypothetical protein [Emticicia]
MRIKIINVEIDNHEFFYVTIRGRFAFSVCCIEKAIEHFKLEHLDWSELFELFWRYPISDKIKDLALWHEKEMECIPSCVLEDLTYSQKMFSFLNEEQHAKFKALYQNSNNIILKIIDLTASVGTQSLYGGVTDGSLITLVFLDEILNLMKSNQIKLPNIAFFQKFNYAKNPSSDWIVWGDSIPKNMLLSQSKWLK